MDALNHLVNAATADSLSVLLEECLPELLQLQGEALKTKRAEDVPLPPLAKAVKVLLPLASKTFQNVTGLTVRAAASVRTICILFTMSLEFCRESKDSQLISKLKKSGLAAVLPDTCSALADAITKQNLVLKQQRKLHQSSKQPKSSKNPDRGSSQHDSSSKAASSNDCATLNSLYFIAASALQTWRCCTAIWDEPSLVTQQATHTITPVTKLVLAVLHTASESSSSSSSSGSSGSPGSNQDSSGEVSFKPCSHAVDMATEAAYAMALLVSKMSFQMSLGPPGFRQLLTLAPEVASDQMLHLLCISFASVVMLNHHQRAAAAAAGVADPAAAAAGAADSATSSSSSRLAEAPEHHKTLLNLLGCSSLLRYGSKSTEAYADKIYLVPYSIYYCLAMRQEEALITIGAPDGGFGFVKPDWEVQLQDPTESVPGKLWLPLARLCVEAFWLLEHRNVCFEVMRLLYKACFYRQYFYKEITPKILDLLLLEAGPALVGLAGERLPRDKTSDSWRAFDYFSDLLMRTLDQEVLDKGNKQKLRNAFKQQPQSTCIVLEAAIRQTSISDEPAVPPDVLLPLANAIGCAATPHAQQYLPVATADAATGSAAAAAAPAAAAHVFSLLLTCTKLALVNKRDVHMRNVTKLVQVAMPLTRVSGHWTIVPDLLRAAVEIQTPKGSSNSIRVWLPTSDSGSFTLCNTADSDSRSSCRNDKVTLDVTPIGPVLHLIGHSLYCLGQVLEAGHSMECLQQTGHCALTPQLHFAQDTLLWLGKVLDILNLAVQAPQQQGTQIPAHNHSTVPRQLLTTKLLQQLQAKHRQAALAMNAATSAWQLRPNMQRTRGSLGSEVLQHLHAADAAMLYQMQHPLQDLGAAITAAVPVVWCCNNAACVKFNRLSERMVKGLCSKCKAARYCCIECQEAQWKLHRPVCKILRGN